jgi:hypothetical protein
VGRGADISLSPGNVRFTPRNWTLSARFNEHGLVFSVAAQIDLDKLIAVHGESRDDPTSRPSCDPKTYDAESR